MSLFGRGAKFVALGASLAAAVVAAEEVCAVPGSCANDGGIDAGESSLLQLKSADRQHAALQAKSKVVSGFRTTYTDPVAEETYQSCYLNKSDCSIESMGGKPTLVYPGGETKCINGDEYAFAVVPGSSKKLLYYFEGGGACWEADGAFGKQVVLQCTDSIAGGIASTGFGNGVQDRSDERNPFRNYTVVEPIYCAGDAFMGNSTMELDGKVLYQKGYYNQMAVLNWAKQNIKPQLENLVVMGFSAGSLGTMAWSDTILSTFSHQKGAVIMDSYAAFFPIGTQGATISRWGACDLPVFSSALQSLCKEKQLTVQAVVKSTMQRFPDVAFASIESKVDSTQVWFYQGMAQSWGLTEDMGLTPSKFYEGTNTIFEEWSNFSNYMTFLVNGDMHCFTQAPEFFTASAVASNAAPEQGQPLMYQWVDTVVNKQTGSIQCAGPAQPNGAEGFEYCDTSLMSNRLVKEVV